MRSSCLTLLVAFAGLLSAVATVRAADEPGSTANSFVAGQILLRDVYMQPTTADLTFPVRDGTYFELSPIMRFGSRWSAELTLGNRKDFSAAQRGGDEGPSQLFSLNINTLTGRYDLYTEGKVRPYIGVGIAYVSLEFHCNNCQGDLQLLHPASVSAVAQGGLDWRITENLFINADVRYLPELDTHFNVYPPGIDAHFDVPLHIRPVLIGLGFGYGFYPN